MANEKPAAPRVVFDPAKLEQLNVSKDYPMEPEDFQRLFRYNAYCEMAHVNKKGFPIGVQIIGRRFDDLGVLGMAKAFEGLRGPQKPWPSPPKK